LPYLTPEVLIPVSKVLSIHVELLNKFETMPFKESAFVSTTGAYARMCEFYAEVLLRTKVTFEDAPEFDGAPVTLPLGEHKAIY
jgi:hypothetical protein